MGESLLINFVQVVFVKAIFFLLQYVGQFQFQFHPGLLFQCHHPSLSRCFHMPFNLVKYIDIAQAQPVLLPGCFCTAANMSSIRSDRSITFTSNSFSILVICDPVSSSSKITSSIFLSCNIIFYFFKFAFANKCSAIRMWNFCINLFIVIAPAVSARNASSSRYSFTNVLFGLYKSSPTKYCFYFLLVIVFSFLSM